MTGLIEGFFVGDGFVGGAAASAVAGAGTSAVAVAAAGASATGAGTLAVTAASVLVSEGFGGAGAGTAGDACAIVSGVFASPSSSSARSSQRRALLNLSSPFRRTFHRAAASAGALCYSYSPSFSRATTQSLRLQERVVKRARRLDVCKLLWKSRRGN